MTLSAQLVAVIEIDFPTLLVFEKIPVFLMMAVDAAQRLAGETMVEEYIASYNFV